MNDKIQLNKARWLVAWTVLLLGAYFYFIQTDWHIHQFVHTLFEAGATIISLFISVLLLVAYRTINDRRFLFLGIGFLGTAILDANHALATSGWLEPHSHSPAPATINWNWNSSRFFLSVLMFLSCWQSIAGSPIVKKSRFSNKSVYLILGALTLGVLVLFAFIPIKNPYTPGLAVGRPIEFPPAIFFLAALIVYLYRAHWKTGKFDYWLVLFLLSSVVYQSLYMPSSRQLFDSMFIVAHILKITSYLFVFMGLIIYMHAQFQTAQINSAAIHKSNLDLQKEMADKSELNDRMRKMTLSLNDVINERTHELEDARLAALNMMEDANEAKKAAEQAKDRLDEQASKLAISNKELEQFAYVASHDLQEPLRTVGSFVQLLAQRYKGKLDDQADEFIQFAVEGVSRMRQLINDLLMFSRVETKGGEFAPTDCEMILGDVLANLKASIDSNEATITHDQMPMIIADKLQLSQVFQNLIGNAIKFKGDKPPAIHIGVNKKGNDWLFFVKDNGIGFDPEFSEKVFIIFQRLHTRNEYPGTGIGLSLCKKIVERHGGKIWVESSPGHGSTFNFTIPDKMGEQNEYSSFDQANRNTIG